MRKIASNNLTVGMLSANFREKKDIISSDQAFAFKNWIKGTSTCWKFNFFDVLRIIKQPSCPRFL